MGVFDVSLGATGFQYRFALFDNPNALPGVGVPRNVLGSYPRFDGSEGSGR